MRQFWNTRMFIGNLKDAGDIAALEKNKIKVILNVCSDIDTPYHPDITLMKVGLDDPQETLAPHNDINAAVMCLDMAERWAGYRSGNVLIHCAAGQNRSALVAAIWGERFLDGLTFEDAVEAAQVKDKKPWMIAMGYVW